MTQDATRSGVEGLNAPLYDRDGLKASYLLAQAARKAEQTKLVKTYLSPNDLSSPQKLIVTLFLKKIVGEPATFNPLGCIAEFLEQALSTDQLHSVQKEKIPKCMQAFMTTLLEERRILAELEAAVQREKKFQDRMRKNPMFREFKRMLEMRDRTIQNLKEKLDVLESKDLEAKSRLNRLDRDVKDLQKDLMKRNELRTQYSSISMRQVANPQSGKSDENGSVRIGSPFATDQNKTPSEDSRMYVYLRRNGSWVSKFRYEGDRIHVGTFQTPEEAAAGYNKKAVEYGKKPIDIESESFQQMVADRIAKRTRLSNRKKKRRKLNPISSAVDSAVNEDDDATQ